jgi:hypothetical protein
MQDIWVSLHSIWLTSTNFWLHHWLTLDIATSATTSTTSSSNKCAPFKILLGILGYWTSSTWGLFWDWHAYKTTLRLALPDSLQPCLEIWVSLHFVQDHDSVFFSFWASNQPCCLLQCSGTTLRVCLQGPLVSLVVPTCWETVSHHVVTRPTFSSSFLDHHTGYPACHDARILLYECIFDALLIFFIVIPIYWKPASYRSSLDLPTFGKTSNRLAAKLTCSFFFWTDVHAIRPVDSSTTSSWPF